MFNRIGSYMATLFLQAPPIMQVLPSRPRDDGANEVVLPVSSSWWAPGRKGAGISMAQQKRASRKARNVARNRRAHR